MRKEKSADKLLPAGCGYTFCLTSGCHDLNSLKLAAWLFWMVLRAKLTLEQMFEL
jgi:hypothetical protein